jgi:hypothetical protein
LRAADPATIVAEWVAVFDGSPRLAIIPNANTTYFYESAASSTPAKKTRAETPNTQHKTPK